MFKKKRTTKQAEPVADTQAPAAEPVAADTKPADPDKPSLRVPRLRAGGTYSSTHRDPSAKTSTRTATRLSTGTTDKGA